MLNIFHCRNFPNYPNQRIIPFLFQILQFCLSIIFLPSINDILTRSFSFSHKWLWSYWANGENLHAYNHSWALCWNSVTVDVVGVVFGAIDDESTARHIFLGFCWLVFCLGQPLHGTNLSQSSTSNFNITHEVVVEF